MAHIDSFRLDGKTILITGASSGIGQACAIECSEYGATVIINGRDENRLKETFNKLSGSEKNHHMILGDLTDPVVIKNIAETVPVLDGIVLCAGKGLTIPISFIDKAQMDELFNIDFYSPVELIRTLYRKKKIQKQGSVVFISSAGGVEIFRPGNSVYGAAKAALNSFMKFCALEFSQRLIRVNSVCPSMIETPFIHNGQVTEEQLEQDKQTYPLKRYGTPLDVANGVVYLLSDASAFVTGISLIIDGGKSI